MDLLLAETDPILSPEDEARRLVAERYQEPHADLEHHQHDLYYRGLCCDQDDCSHPACQAEPCDACHRVLALLYASSFCGSRAELQPILNWILDPEYLS